MTNKKALQWFRFKFDKAKDYYDEHWDATERREHEEYVEAMNCAIKALAENEKLKSMLKQVADDIEKHRKKQKKTVALWDAQKNVCFIIVAEISVNICTCLKS